MNKSTLTLISYLNLYYNLSHLIKLPRKEIFPLHISDLNNPKGDNKYAELSILNLYLYFICLVNNTKLYKTCQ